MAYGFNLGQIEGLDSSVKTVTLTIANATESNTYTLTYVNSEGWADLDNTLTVVDGNFHLQVIGITDSNLGEVYDITLTTESVEPNFKAAVKETIDKEYINGDEHIGTTSFSEMLGSTILQAANAADPSTGEFNVAFNFDNDTPILNSICWQAYNGVRHIKGNLSASAGVFDFNASYDTIIKSILIHPEAPDASSSENPFPQTEIFFDIDLYSFIAILHGTVIVMGARGQNGGVHGARIYGKVYSMTD